MKMTSVRRPRGPKLQARQASYTNYWAAFPRLATSVMFCRYTPVVSGGCIPWKFRSHYVVDHIDGKHGSNILLRFGEQIL